MLPVAPIWFPIPFRRTMLTTLDFCLGKSHSHTTLCSRVPRPYLWRPDVCAVCNLITFELRNRTKFAWAEKQSKADTAGQNKSEQAQAGQQHAQSCFKWSECRASLKFIIHKLNFMRAVRDLQIQFCICIWICEGIFACCCLSFHLHYRLMLAEFLILVTRTEKQQQNLHKIPRA